MGNNIWSEQKEINNTIEKLKTNPTFIIYTRLFNSLSPSRKVSIENNELIIEVNHNKVYSISRDEFKWTEPDIIEFVLNYLQELYATYLNQNIYNNTNISSNIYTEHPVIDFVIKSINHDIKNWTRWVKTYVYPNSQMYRLFMYISKYKKNKNTLDIHTETDSDLSGSSENPEDNLIYSPAFIWYFILKNNESIGKFYAVEYNEKPQDKPQNKTQNKPQDNPTFKILDHNNNVLAIISYMNKENKYYYTKITLDCFNKVWNLYKSQPNN